ncbi:MBL fold metallo-hydrolase [Rariglobus hedericola]|uniref:MBL fold metallo-hydrolase n=1 Tax=Rariglobus hedericola TaxID=2597822 RepID=A0A556QNK3_9BACT|nr:MBL fold metallo-hydrolase [Rariglobus hedericola]TSJ78182.1 MBL fold metallo-hydrolase [Rariglobus hedericola]
MIIHTLPAGPIETNGFLLTDAARGEAVLIDAPGGIWAFVEPILIREKCRLTELWLTHGHWDHIQDAAKVVRASGAKVRGHLADRTFFDTPEIMSAFLSSRITLEKIAIDHWVAQGDRFEALGRSVEVRHVPGHCPGNVLFYFADECAAFVGDALFAGSVGRTDLPGGSREQLLAAIRAQIYTMPDATTVYPGHGPSTSVGVEKRSNPYVRG